MATDPTPSELMDAIAALDAVRDLVQEIHGHGADTLEGEMWRLRTILNRIEAVVSP